MRKDKKNRAGILLGIQLLKAGLGFFLFTYSYLNLPGGIFGVESYLLSIVSILGAFRDAGVPEEIAKTGHCDIWILKQVSILGLLGGVIFIGGDLITTSAPINYGVILAGIGFLLGGCTTVCRSYLMISSQGLLKVSITESLSVFIVIVFIVTMKIVAGDLPGLLVQFFLITFLQSIIFYIELRGVDFLNSSTRENWNFKHYAESFASTLLNAFARMVELKVAMSISIDFLDKFSFAQKVYSNINMIFGAIFGRLGIIKLRNNIDNSDSKNTKSFELIASFWLLATIFFVPKLIIYLQSYSLTDPPWSWIVFVFFVGGLHSMVAFRSYVNRLSPSSFYSAGLAIDFGILTIMYLFGSGLIGLSLAIISGSVSVIVMLMAARKHL